MRRLLLVALVAAGCSHQHPGIRVATRYTAQALPLAEIDSTTRDVAACPGAFALTTVRGGILMAGWNGWFREPARDAATSVGCSDDGVVYAIVGRYLALTDRIGRELDEVAPLPAGSWHVTADGRSNVWVWGEPEPGRSAVLVFSNGHVFEMFSGPGHFQAAAASPAGGLFGVVDGVLLLWRMQMATRAVGRVPVDVDGIAFDRTGAMLLSSPRGILRRESLNTPAQTVATGVHGPLVVRPNGVYVLSRERRLILRLSY